MTNNAIVRIVTGFVLFFAGAGCGKNAITELERHGMAVSTATPRVIIFVPKAMGQERKFGDDDLFAVGDALKWVNADSLDLSGTSVTDRCLAEIKQLDCFVSLNLSDTNVHVQSLAELRGMKNLKIVVISERQASEIDPSDVPGLLPSVRITQDQFRITGPS